MVFKKIYSNLFNKKEKYNLVYFFNQKIPLYEKGTFELMRQYFNPIENFSSNEKILVLNEVVCDRQNPLYKRRKYCSLTSKLKLKNRVSLINGSRSTIITFPENEVHPGILNYFKEVYNSEPRVIKIKNY